MPFNPFEMLRFQNIFAPDNPISAAPSIDPTIGTGYDSPMMTPDFNFQPEHVQIDRMNQMINDFPQRDKPSFARKLFASLAGAAGGPDAADRIAYAPYYRDVEDWQNQFKGVAAAANQERYNNTNMRMYADSIARERSRDREISRKEARDADQNRIADEKLKIQRLRAEAYDFKTRNPNWLELKGKGGTVKFYNPQDPKMIYDTGLDRGTMDERDKLNLLGEQRMEQIGAHESAATERTGMTVAGANERNEESIAAANERARLAQEGANARNDARINNPRTGATKVRSQADIAKEVENKARQYEAQHPGTINFDRSNRFRGIKPASPLPSIWGISQDEHDAAYQAIYGGTSVMNSNTPTAGAGKVPQQAVPPEGWLRVRRKSDGQTGKILLKDYDAKKYDKIVP